MSPLRPFAIQCLIPFHIDYSHGVIHHINSFGIGDSQVFLSHLSNNGHHTTEGWSLSRKHKRIEPAILYLKTPVVLNSTVNEDGSYNLAPISSAFCWGGVARPRFEA